MEPGFESVEFRTILGHFATGVTVITGCRDGTPVGLAANAFTSVSLDPPYVLICVARTSKTWPLIRETGAFVVNMLAEHHEQLCRKFASSDPDRFAGIDWKPASTGSPIISDALAYLDCTIETEHEAGDHDIVLGRVVGLGRMQEARPLVFWRGGYPRLVE